MYISQDDRLKLSNSLNLKFFLKYLKLFIDILKLNYYYKQKNKHDLAKMNKPVVTSIPINNNYRQALTKTFHAFPRVIKKIKTSNEIFIKINIDHFHNYLHTDIELLQLILQYIRQINSSCLIFVMENNLMGNFTRLVANISGISQLIKKYKAKFLYLDEQKSTAITIGPPEDRYKIQFPEILLDHSIKENFYLNLANLKTHFQVKVAGGIFNQIGLINYQSHRLIHSHYLHQTLADLLGYIQPDFTIIDAKIVLARGNIPPQCLIQKYGVPLNRLLGGIDSIAVDRVALQLLGYSLREVEYIKLLIEQNLGEGDLDEIDIQGELPSQSFRIPYTLELSQLPSKMDIIIGNKKNSINVCLELTLLFAQIIHKDFAGEGAFSLIVGNDFSKKQLENLHEPIVILGSSACNEVASFLKRKYHEVYYIEQCSNVCQIIAVLIKIMRISKYHFIGSNPLTVWKHLLSGKLRGLKYKLPSIDREVKKWIPAKKKKDVKK